MTAPLRLLLVDDDALVRSGLRALLDAEPDLTVVADTDDGVDVVDLARRHAVDVVLMDVRMPRVDGITATARLLDALVTPPKVVVLTTFGHDDAVHDALRAGASGFLLKRARPAEIADAVRTVARGDALLFPEALRALLGARAGPAPDRPAVWAGLTDREREVLARLARGASNAEIAAELVLGTETVKTHVAAVLGKLGARDRTQAVVIAYESGFVRPGRA